MPSLVQADATRLERAHVLGPGVERGRVVHLAVRVEVLDEPGLRNA